MGTLIARNLPFLLLAAGIVALLLTGRPLLTSGRLSARQDKFRSLAAASPVLDVLIAISVIGKPFLDHLQKNGWQSDLLPPTPLLVLVSILVVSLWAMLGSILFFFMRAIQNINHFTQRRVRAPYSALFMIVPISNLVVIPYIQYFAYYRSRALVRPQGASRIGAALLVALTFGLLLVSLTCGYAGNAATATAHYNPASLMLIGTVTGLAAGILTTRIVDGIAGAQEAYAIATGALPSMDAAPAPKSGKRWLQALKSVAVGALIVVALWAALVPDLASQAVHIVIDGFRG